MNYKVKNSKIKREQIVHVKGNNSSLYIPYNGGKVASVPTTICGLKMQKTLYGKWEQTPQEPTCKRCLKKSQQGS